MHLPHLDLPNRIEETAVKSAPQRLRQNLALPRSYQEPLTKVLDRTFRDLSASSGNTLPLSLTSRTVTVTVTLTRRTVTLTTSRKNRSSLGALRR
jgi:hypothetical protein